MTITFNFSDEQLRGITAARDTYNASLSIMEDGSQSPDFKNTNEDYITFVILSAADSYAAHYPVI